MRRRSGLCLAFGGVVGFAIFIGCSVTVEPGGGDTGVAFTIAGTTITFTLGTSSTFDVPANSDAVRKAVEIPLFDDTPTDTPATGELTLDANRVQAIPLDIPKGLGNAQAITGSATIVVYVAGSTAENPCTEGVNIGSFGLTFTDGVVTLDRSSLALPPDVLVHVITGTFRMCMEVTATVSVTITIDEMGCVFGPPQEPGGCLTNADCAGGETCQSGACVSSPGGCSSDSDCDGGESCVSGECVPISVGCTSDADCDTGETCVDGDCVPVTAGCISDSDCDAGETCVEGDCQAETGGCTSDADCDATEACVAGACVPLGTQCTIDADCGPDETCEAGFCLSTDECTSDPDCDAGEMCVLGVCIPDTTSCTSDTDCLPGEVCFAGLCVPDIFGCTSDGDCSIGEVCLLGTCVPGVAACTSDADCGADETCVDGICVAGPADGGFTTATIIHRGSEQVIAGPNVDPAYGTVTPAGYGMGGYKQTALSGDNTKVWFVLYDEFPNVEGDPQLQLWSVNLDGTNGQRSVVPGEDSGYGLSVETSFDGSICYADDRSASKMFRATPGAAATEAFAYWNATDGYLYGDIRAQFKISDDATKMVYRSYVDERFMSVDLTASPNTPVEMADGASLPFLGVDARGVFANIDMAADGSRWIGVTDHWNPDWEPTLRSGMWIGNGLGAGATPTLHAGFSNLDGGEDLNITDDGSTIGYCLKPDGSGFNAPNECIVEAVGGSSSTSVGDGRTWVGSLVLADDGSRAHYLTDTCCSGGTGIFEDIATGEKIGSGSLGFLVDWGNKRLSDDGDTLLSSSYSAGQPGVFVLRDGTDPPSGFPSIDNLSYKFETTGDDCSLFVRVAASSPRGIETIFANPYIDGVDPTEVIAGDVNPMFAARTGFFWAFTAVDGLENVWEYEIRLTNDVGVCVSDLLTSDYRLRVTVMDSNDTMSVFQDFVPAP